MSDGGLIVLGVSMSLIAWVGLVLGWVYYPEVMVLTIMPGMCVPYILATAPLYYAIETALTGVPRR